MALADGACDSPILPLTGGRRSCALGTAGRRIPTSIHARIRQMDTVGGSSCHLPKQICWYGTVLNLLLVRCLDSTTAYARFVGQRRNLRLGFDTLKKIGFSFATFRDHPAVD